MQVSRKVRIHGRVQGVWYRAWAVASARDLGLVGWVRNCSDGTVEAHVQGEGDRVARFIEMAEVGPRLAEVSQIEVEECASLALTSFVQRR